VNISNRNSALQFAAADRGVVVIGRKAVYQRWEENAAAGFSPVAQLRTVWCRLRSGEATDKEEYGNLPQVPQV